MSAPPARSSRRHGWAGRAGSLPYLLAMLPALALLTLLFIVPAIWVVGTSLTDRALLGFGARETSFIGLDNFRLLYENPDFSKILWNTMVFAIGSAVIGQVGLGLAIALLLNATRKRAPMLTALAYAAVLLSWICPPAFAGAIWGQLFDLRHGAVNELLTALGFGRLNLLGDQPMLAVILADIWRGTAFPMVVMLGALQTVPPGVYEAARVDGAGRWRLFADHTLPITSRILVIALTMTTILTVGSFLLIAVLTNGDPGYQTETLALFAYHRAIQLMDIGFGSAISVVLLLLNLLFAAIFLAIIRRMPSP